MTLPSITADGLAGVPGAPWPCSLGGRQYILDLSRDGGLVERTIPLLRNQADTSQTQMESEASLNPEDLVRRAGETWHLGAGQEFRDRKDSEPERFYVSSGINPWTKWRATLHQKTRSIRSLTTSPTGGGLVAVGAYLYVIDGQDLYRTGSLSGTPTWTTITGNPAATAVALATDGAYVYIAYGSSGLYRSAVGSGSMSSAFTGTVANVGFAKDRLLTLNGGGVITNPTDFTGLPKALPTALWDHGNNWVFSCIGEGLNHIYIGGFSSSLDRSVVHKTTVKPEGTGLDVPTVAAQLPDGELVETICGYLGYVLLGTSNPSTGVAGFRLCEQRDDGNLILGPRVEEAGAYGVFAFEPQGSYVWYGKDAGSLGRIDLTRFTSDLVPAYAADLDHSAIASDLTRGIVTFANQRVWRVDDSALVTENTTEIVQAGYINLGKFAYGLQDDKVAMFIDVAFEGAGSVQVFIGIDGGTLTQVGSLSATGSISLNGLSGKEFELSLYLTRDEGAPNTSPKLRRVTLRSFIAANRTREYIAPLIIRPTVTRGDGTIHNYASVRDEIDAIAAMVGTVVVWKMGNKTEYVQVKDYEWHPDYYQANTGEFGGTCTVRLQRLQASS